MEYIEWNYLLARYFFNEEMDGKNVILYVDENIINTIGARDNVGLADFVEAIKKGHHAMPFKEDICTAAYSLYYKWRESQRFKYPPYLAYLIFFVLVVDQEGDFSNIAYYPRFNQLLNGVTDSKRPKDFEKMEELWIDLEQWSVNDKKETFGKFIARRRGLWTYVGLALSQTLISPSERSKLPRFFIENNLEPGDIPDEAYLINCIAKSTCFRSYTRQILFSNNKDEKELRSNIISFICEELKMWDGVVDFNDDEDLPNQAAINTGIRMCISYNKLTLKAQVTVRVKSATNFPEGGIQLTRQRDNTQWIGIESKESWSRPLFEAETGNKLDGAILDWFNGEIFNDPITKWTARLKPSMVRVFMVGMAEGIGDYVEENRIERNTEYIIAYHKTISNKIEAWLEKNCENKKLLKLSGTPINWEFIKVSSILKSNNEFSVLTFPASYSLTLHGGVKSGRGKTYFCEAPPRIFINSKDGKFKLYVNNELLLRNEDSGWRIPQELMIPCILDFELRQEESVLARSRVILEEPRINKEYNVPGVTKYGKVTNEDKDIVVRGLHIDKMSLNDLPKYIGGLPTYLSNRIIFIGKNVGEYCNWPDDPLPEQWIPIWALIHIKRDLWEVEFVGKDISDSNISSIDKNNPKWKKWKKAISNNNVKSPEEEHFKKLWLKYKREARVL